MRKVMVGQVSKRRIKSRNEDAAVVDMPAEMARKIAAHVPAAGEQATAIPGLTLYRRTSPTPCYPATYEPSLNVFVQGRKRVNLGGTTYLCDESTFLLSSVDVPVVSQIVTASEEVPLLSLLLKLDMAIVRDILSQEEFHALEGSSQGRGIAIGKTTIDLLRPCSRLLDLLDVPEDIPFLSKLIQRDRVPLTSRPSRSTSPCDRNAGRPKSQNGEGHRLAQGQLHETVACRRTRGGCTHGHVNTAPSLPRLDRDEPTSIPKTASISYRARANADRGARCC